MPFDAKQKALPVPLSGTKSAVAFRGTTRIGRSRPAFSTCAGPRRCLPAVTCRTPAEPTDTAPGTVCSVGDSGVFFGRKSVPGSHLPPALFDYHSVVLFPSQSLREYFILHLPLLYPAKLKSQRGFGKIRKISVIAESFILLPFSIILPRSSPVLPPFSPASSMALPL